MSHQSVLCSPTRCSIGLVLVVTLLLVSADVFGQLTDEDIRVMREKGERDGWTFEVGSTEAAKFPLEQICGGSEKMILRKDVRFKPFPSVAAEELPARFDWRDSGAVTPIKYQFPCGSCWAHATAGVLESAIMIVDGIEEDLSEQWLVSCNRDGFSCSGGGWAYDYFLNRGSLCGDSGSVFESVFPYAAIDADCDCPYAGDRYFIEEWGYIGTELGLADVSAMKRAMLEHGPIGTAVYVSEDWQAYTGGVYNACQTGPLNHLVVLVGWDDTQGENGVWIMKNSFGSDWGEDGYMYIEYGCSMVGYASTYVVYGGPVKFSAVPDCGPVLLETMFTAQTGFEVSGWSWDFGDGGTSSAQNPVHVYDETGVFDVTVRIDTESGQRSVTKDSCVVVHADTVKGGVATATPGEQVETALMANNTMPVRYLKVPIEFGNDFGMQLDSFSTVGCRTEYFQIQQYAHYDPFWGQRITLKLVSSEDGTQPYLEPGSGVIARLYFTIPDGAADGQTAIISLDGYDTFLPEYESPTAAYRIESLPGKIDVVEGCCLLAGDCNHDGLLDLSDIQFLREYLHKGGAEPPCLDEADVNRDGLVTQEDVSCMARYFFSSGNPCEFAGCR